jgi:menaquinone-dependent protoporphyrinogen oxidase
MPRVLVAYATSWGHTARVCHRLAEELLRRGHQVTLARIEDLQGDALEAYDAAMIGASVIYGRHQRAARRFVREHVRRLNSIPSAFVSVCGAVMGTWEQGPAVARGYVEHFTGECEWHPTLATPVAGELAYRRYSFLTRLVMRAISWRIGRPTDTTRNHDLTDWSQVDRIAEEFAAQLAPEQVPARASAPSPFPAAAPDQRAPAS